MQTATKSTRTFGQRSNNAITLNAVISTIQDQFPLVDEFARAGITLKKSGYYSVGICPFHDESKASLKISANNPRYFRCYGCGASGNVFTVMKLLYGQDCFADQVKYLTGRALGDWFRTLDCPTGQKIARDAVRKAEELNAQRKLEAKKWEPVDDRAAESVYMKLLSLLTLDPKHLLDLERRGIDKETAELLMYRSIPPSVIERASICARLISAGHRLARVPGFFQIETGKYAGMWCFSGNKEGMRELKVRGGRKVYEVPGILLPTTDPEGRIVRLKIRNDNPPSTLPDELSGFWPTKYLAMSSYGRKGGAGGGERLHHVGPEGGGDYPGILWVTEGEFKADITSMKLGCRIIGTPGVGHLSDSVISSATGGGYHTLFIANDQDNKDQVLIATLDLILRAQEKRLDPKIIVWDGAIGKGIDDLLVSGGKWRSLKAEHWFDGLTIKQKTMLLDSFEDRAPQF